MAVSSGVSLAIMGMEGHPESFETVGFRCVGMLSDELLGGIDAGSTMDYCD
jgi:hypothetical protein